MVLLFVGFQGSTDAAAPQYLVDDERKYPSRESLGPLCELLWQFLQIFYGQPL